jgi:hypothetical protein
MKPIRHPQPLLWLSWRWSTIAIWSTITDSFVRPCLSVFLGLFHIDLFGTCCLCLNNISGNAGGIKFVVGPATVLSLWAPKIYSSCITENSLFRLQEETKTPVIPKDWFCVPHGTVGAAQDAVQCQGNVLEGSEASKHLVARTDAIVPKLRCVAWKKVIRVNRGKGRCKFPIWKSNVRKP